MAPTPQVAAAILALMLTAACNKFGDNPVPQLDVGYSPSLSPTSSSERGYARPSNSSYAQPALATASSGSVNRAPLGSSQNSAGQTFGSRSLAGEQDQLLADAGEQSYDERRDRNAPRTLESQAASLGLTSPDPEPRAQAPLRKITETQHSASPKLALAEVTGVGADAAQPLARRFGSQAKAHNIEFTSASDKSATHVVKGYFSTADDGGKTYVSYVWDITDPRGNRLHRITGRELGGGNGSGWDAVSDQAMQNVADRSIQEMSDFLGNSPV